MNVIIETEDIVTCIADAVDLITDGIRNHHRRVACISYHIGKEYGLASNQLENLIVAALIHDIGALTSKENLSLLEFEEVKGNHAKYGARLLIGFKPFAHLAPIVEEHHTHWNKSKQDKPFNNLIPVESRIIYLADRIAVLIKPDFKLNQVEEIIKLISQDSGTRFQPDLVNIFCDVAQKESFWLEAKDALLSKLLVKTISRNLHLDSTELLNLGKIFSQMIDFRSSFTATHSTGVSTVAEMLAEFIGFSEDECLLMRLAGNLHDIGKLVIPIEILEKKGPLTTDEMDIIRSHTYYTDKLLLNIEEFYMIRVWGALHHEKLNGKGYPFKLKANQIPLGSRIMAVADVFTAITEDRPYRKGMKEIEVLQILDNMVTSGSLDKRVVNALIENYKVIDSKRCEKQSKALQEYLEFYEQ